MIEAELKARVEDPDSTRALLRAAAGEPEAARYEDTYLYRDGELDRDGRELRVRTVTTDAVARRRSEASDPTSLHVNRGVQPG